MQSSWLHARAAGCSRIIYSWAMRNEVRSRLFPEAYLLLCETAQPFLLFLNFSALSVRHLRYFRLIKYFYLVPSGFLLVSMESCVQLLGRNRKQWLCVIDIWLSRACKIFWNVIIIVSHLSLLIKCTVYLFSDTWSMAVACLVHVLIKYLPKGEFVIPSLIHTSHRPGFASRSCGKNCESLTC